MSAREGQGDGWTCLVVEEIAPRIGRYLMAQRRKVAKAGHPGGRGGGAGIGIELPRSHVLPRSRRQATKFESGRRRELSCTSISPSALLDVRGLTEFIGKKLFGYRVSISRNKDTGQRAAIQLSRGGEKFACNVCSENDNILCTRGTCLNLFYNP